MFRRVMWLLIFVIVVLLLLSWWQSLGSRAVFSAPRLPSSDPASASSRVVGPPSLSAVFINRVLAASGSPAAGTGAVLFALSQQYRIDDAYALAFFQHESRFGTTGVARLTHSLGNIRCSSGYRCIAGYRAYASWVVGYQDWYALLRSFYVSRWHLTTVQQIIPVYAPASDHNDVPAYIAAVVQAVAAWRAGRVEVQR